eukprot:1146917-Rhodomonas_salina.4
MFARALTSGCDAAVPESDARNGVQDVCDGVLHTRKDKGARSVRSDALFSLACLTCRVACSMNRGI